MEWQAIGHSVELKAYTNEAGEVMGYWFSHAVPVDEIDVEPGRCRGRIPVSGPNAWAVDQAEPLTLSPSVLCVSHNFHGFVRNGAWVMA